MSALVNPTWWVLCAALAVSAVARDPHQALAVFVRRATCLPLLALLACAAVVNVGARAMLGHAVPGDFVQEVVAARSLGTGSPLYPRDVNDDVRSYLAADPPTVARWLPGAIVRWIHARREDGRNRLVAQAHPPTLLLTTAPLVLALGASGAYWIVTCLSIAAAAFIALALTAVFAPASPTRVRVLAVVVLVSWQPVLATVRDGQASVIIGALLVLGWRELRRGHDLAGGAAVGAAGALKLYPLLLLAPLAVRRPRALAAALLVIGGAAATVTLVCGPGVWQQYGGSVRVVARSFSHTPYNLSVVARLASGLPDSLLWVVYPVAAAAATGVTLRAGLRGPSKPGEGSLGAFDLVIASFVTLSLLLSPVAWHHYASMLAFPLAVLLVSAWNRAGRASLGAALALALAVSLPDDAWRVVWREVPSWAALLVSAGMAVITLWIELLRAAGKATRQYRGCASVPICSTEPC